MGAPITSLAMSMDSVFAAASNIVGRYVRGKEVGRFVLSTTPSSRADSDSDSDSSSDSDDDSDSDSDSDDSDMGDAPPVAETLTSLTLFGTTLVALSSSGSRMYVWDVPHLVNPASKAPSASDSTPTAEPVTPYATLDFPTGFTASKIVHPASYLNKVVVGSKEGELAVWNVRTGWACSVLVFDLGGDES